MQRPVMHPTFLEDNNGDTPAPKPKRRIRIIRPVLRFFGRVLFSDAFSLGRRREATVEGVPFLTRVFRGLMYRLAFLPIVATLVAIALVFAGTHPPTAAIHADPGGMGLFFETVPFSSSDQIKLEAWVIPVYEAEKILLEGTKALSKKQPAILLVHDFAGNREQMLPLVKPLHDAGIVVMIVGLRSSGEGLPMGETFGLRESQDVSAAVSVLRRRPFVDEKQVAVLGVGTGATAALLAADRDPTISALVLDRPLKTAGEIVERIGPPKELKWLTFLKPLCQWTFELAYKVDLNDLNMERLAKNTARVPKLELSGTNSAQGTMSRQAMGKVTSFLSTHLAGTKVSKPAVVADLPRK